MHTIFETDTFVLKSYPSGEANKVLELFTRDFGLIRASAQGLRQYRSKLRYSLTDFSRVRISLVRGKEFWRVTTGVKISSITTDIPEGRARDAMLRVCVLLRRLLQGEEAHPELFEVVEHAQRFLEREGVEELVVLRMLFLLGYVRDEPNLHRFIKDLDYTQETIVQAAEKRIDIVSEINRALKASGL